MSNNLELIECCKVFLTLLIRLYEEGRISREDFRENVKTKIEYLTQDMDDIKDTDIKLELQDIINKTNAILQND